MSSILCFGEVLWDLFPAGNFLGGAPLNVAYHLCQLNHQASIVSAVGCDALGDEALTRMRLGGVDTRWVKRSDSLPTGVALVSFDPSGHASFQLPEPVAWDRIPAPDFDGTSPAAILFGTLALRSGYNRKSLADLLDRFPDASVVCDLNLRPPFDHLAPLEPFLKRAHLIKLNDAEAATLSGGLTVPEAAEALQGRFGVRTLCVTLGADGALLRHGDTVVECPAPPTKVVDTVGAGDAFTAGLVSGILNAGTQPDWKRILAGAAALGSFVAGSAGAQPSHHGFKDPNATLTS